MKLRNLFLSAAAVALVGVAYGCNENPTEPEPGNGPTGLMASSLSETSVALKWTAVTGATNYRVKWTSTSATAATGEKSSGTPDAIVTGLTSGARYTFSIYANTADGESDASTIEWAGATRYEKEFNGVKYIRMYEAESSEYSGLQLDPNEGGPVAVSLLATLPGRAQLAFYLGPRLTGTRIDSIVIGPILAIPEYKVSALANLAKIDTTAYISSEGFAASSLTSWYLEKSLDKYILANGNVSAFVLTGNEITRTSGLGFIIRHGLPGDYNYARVLVRNNGGIVQGIYPNRYIEMEVSYQRTPNVPFAKPVNATYNPVIERSIVLD